MFHDRQYKKYKLLTFIYLNNLITINYRTYWRIYPSKHFSVTINTTKPNTTKVNQTKIPTSASTAIE